MLYSYRHKIVSIINRGSSHILLFVSIVLISANSFSYSFIELVKLLLIVAYILVLFFGIIFLVFVVNLRHEYDMWEERFSFVPLKYDNLLGQSYMRIIIFITTIYNGG